MGQPICSPRSTIACQFASKNASSITLGSRLLCETQQGMFQLSTRWIFGVAAFFELIDCCVWCRSVLHRGVYVRPTWRRTAVCVRRLQLHVPRLHPHGACSSSSTHPGDSGETLVTDVVLSRTPKLMWIWSGTPPAWKYFVQKSIQYITLQSFSRRFYPKRLTVSEFNIGRQDNYWSPEVLRAFSSWTSNQGYI